ncbi:type IV pilus modification protein PilV [Acinetobacter sp. ASP199]|uniref:type IV pilus modification protein PilV n=1 Tax=unclassified Acinetobacter TaxID=196816 RepID=UPI001F60D844|nr:type IV pilus modification protein PilV [Acinetobacter sp. ASP199]UNT58994.1 type IV pilus modification protein PilV [Acinetobacter sp. ASP199]
MNNNQKGVGLIEVLVSLLVLAIGVLGFVVLQARAVEATGESAQRIQAINIARDVTERIRANRGGWASYKTQLASTAKQRDGSVNCTNTTNCSAADLADYDARELEQYASSLGMNLALLECPKTGTTDSGRHCLFIAWNNTSATDNSSDSDTACTKGITYQSKSTCLIMEVY